MAGSTGVVRDRARGQTPLAALHAAFRTGLDNREPDTGLCELPEVLDCYRLVPDTPTLNARLSQFLTGGERSLAEALGPSGDLDARPAPGAIIVVRRNLSEANRREPVAGRSAAQRYPIAVAEAERAFDLPANGFRDGPRP
ncbi:hypothetical protein [Nocardia brevicatena]|uniref:hypothetical protein n=1 Tax=Nocardia brevicatena TaxID=37327 RepID=UPI0002F4B250|nr:hypothetical protein [Nocardia brevicatena]